jgi:imidazolonepropionase
LMIALAVREMGMTPAEALWAATAGGAAALRRDDIGVLAPGRRADLAVVDGPSHVHLAYRPGGPIARTLEVSGT